jgi:phage terminase large subunit-like protein
MEPQSALLEAPARIEDFSRRYLTHVKGDLAGQPLLFADWQRQLLRTVFNQVDENGARQIRTFYLSVPRKAGKSTLAAAIALYMLVSDGERGAEIYSAAKAAKQARG